MNLIRRSTQALAVLAVLALAASGCSKEEKKEEAAKDEAASPAEGDKAAKAVEKAPGAARAVAGSMGKSGFAIMDKESNLVLGFSLAKVTASALWKQFGPLVMAQAGEDYQKFKATCGMDPMTAIESVIIGGKIDDEDSMVFVMNGVTRSQLIDCGKKMAAAEGEKIEIADEGKLTKVVDKEGQTMYLGWLDDKTMVGSPKGEDKAVVEGILAGKGGLDGNAEMMNLLGNTDTNGALWFAVSDTGDMGSGGPVKFNAAYGTVSFEGGLKLDVGMRTASAEDATKAVDELTKQLAGLKGGPTGKFVSKLQLKANEADVIAQLSLTDAELMELIQTVMSDPGAMGFMNAFGG
ncbi:MAG: hypothetical protein AAGC55_04945 [Myxococcota bacterium]